ncbi:MAG: hypothetical protein WCD89_02360 [Anaerocolumna sp.]
MDFDFVLQGYEKAMAVHNSLFESNNLEEHYNFIVKNLRYTTTPPSRIYEITESEKTFLMITILKFINAGLENKINLIRMADGTLNINYSSYPIGCIRLIKKKTYMQILTSLYGHYSIEYCKLEEYINKIDEWITYTKYIVDKETY